MKIGQRVRVKRHLARRSVRDYTLATWHPAHLQQEWVPQDLKSPVEGIVTGLRTRWNGYTQWDSEEGNTFIQTGHVPAVLVTFSLHRNPLNVSPEDLEVVDD